MKALLNLWSGRSSPLLVLALVLIGSVSLQGCSKVLPSLLGGGGPNVAANVQAGKTNTQTVGTNKVNNQKLVRPQAKTINQSSDETKVKAENVESITMNQLPTWVWIIAILLFILGWVTDTPATYIKNFRKEKTPKA